MNTIKSRITEAEKGCNCSQHGQHPITHCGKGRNVYVGEKEVIEYCIKCQAEISLLHSILLDLAKEWQRLDKEQHYNDYESGFKYGEMYRIEQFTGFSPDELKEMK